MQEQLPKLKYTHTPRWGVYLIPDDLWYEKKEVYYPSINKQWGTASASKFAAWSAVQIWKLADSVKDKYGLTRFAVVDAEVGVILSLTGDSAAGWENAVETLWKGMLF